MDGVTDVPFRAITKKYGYPDLMYTEFTSVEGLGHGAVRLLSDFQFDEPQRPIVAQIYGTTPDYFYQVALVLCALGFDGIDINMGCPAKSVSQRGAGAALILTPDVAKTIVRSTKQAVTDWQNGFDVFSYETIDSEIRQLVQARHQTLPDSYQDRSRPIPVSIKTRIGYDHDVADEWVTHLLETEPAAIAIHGRTLKQGYSGEANWEVIGRAAELIHHTDTKVIGNGDIDSLESAHEKAQTYGVDGVLIGRASFGNPFVFQPQAKQPAITQLAQIALEHAKLYQTTYQAEPKYYFAPMRKHLGWYMREFAHAKQVRIELFQTNSPEDVERVLSKHGLLK